MLSLPIRSLRILANRAVTSVTCGADHTDPPLAVGIPCPVKASAISVGELTPFALSFAKIGERSFALLSARSDCSCLPSALASSDSLPPLLPPSRCPRALAAASAAFVRAEMSPASNSATAAICCSMKRPVDPSIAGRSANRTSTPASSSRPRKPTERVNRSTLATTSAARWRRVTVSASSNAGLSFLRPLSTSVNSATTFVSPSPR
jgi:hypothetical protein